MMNNSVNITNDSKQLASRRDAATCSRVSPRREWLTRAVIAITLISIAHAKVPPAAAQRLVGVGSCTSVGCHGGTRPESIVGSEYSIWVSQDPHARAYSALFDERSVRMVRQLGFQPAHLEHRCLVCHSMKHAAPADQNFDVISDGVGCESCHGPASQWIGEHYQGKLAPQAKERLGMWDTDQLLVRAQVCVECHVGGPDREVNHDLIAAGHPRLQFEMGAYFAALPKHWIDAKDREGREAAFDARLWALGQVSTSQAALEQLARRAASGHIWPEFSEWSCSACHHDLRDDAGVQKSLADREGLSGRVIEWDTWNHFVTRGRTGELRRAFGLKAAASDPIDADVESLASRMRPMNPDRQQVAAIALRAARALETLATELEQSGNTQSNLDTLILSLLRAKTSAADWSTAAQTYNALATLQETRLRPGARRDDRLTNAVQRLYDELAAKQRTPKSYVFDAEQMTSHFQQVGRHLTTNEDAR
jgi:hypothetical protein